MKINRFLSIGLISYLLVSCSSQVRLNRMKHSYGSLPTKIIWLQIPGLSYEQLSILKLLGDDLEAKNEFEKFHCSGSLSNFSLSAVRTKPELSFVSQMTGVSSMNKCSDYDNAPIWKLAAKQKFSIGFFQDQNQNNRKSCAGKRDKFYSDATQWIMSSESKKAFEKKALFFHSDEVTSFKKSQVYYDRSCSTGKCFSSYDKNIKNTLSRYIKNKNFYVYIANISTYKKVVASGNINQIKEELKRLSNLISYIKGIVSQQYDAVLLITSSASQGIELPMDTKDWKSQLSGGKAIAFRKTQTQSPVMAYGANAESFCGLFHESEVAKRLLTTP